MKSGRESRAGRQQQQQHTPCPGCLRNEKYLEMTAIWEKYSRHKERKINAWAFNKTHLTQTKLEACVLLPEICFGWLPFFLSR